MIRMSHGWIVAAVVLLMLGLTPATTQAAPAEPPRPGAALLLAVGDSATCTIRSIHGLAAAGGLDKRLRPLHKQLARPPFSSFKTMKLIKASALVIPQSSTKKVTLPTGKILKLTFKEKLLGRKDKIRLRMHLSITPPKKTGFLPGTLFTIANGGTLLVAGDKYNSGTLVVGVTCQAK
jgi:hypothetical protein